MHHYKALSTKVADVNCYLESTGYLVIGRVRKSINIGVNFEEQGWVQDKMTAFELVEGAFKRCM